MSVILDSHPQITCGPEMSLFNKRVFYDDYKVVKRELRSWLRQGVSTDGYCARPRLMRMRCWDGLTDDFLCKMVSTSRDLREFIIRLQEHCTKRRGKTYFADKTPSNVYCFREFARLFPECRLIHMIRDGRDVVCSLKKRGSSIFEGASLWLYNAAAGVANRDLPQYMEVRYEEMVASPRQVIEKVCEHLGVEYADQMIEKRKDTPEKPIGVGSWKSSPSGPISTESVGRYKHELDDSDLGCFYRTQLTEIAALRLGLRAYTTADLLKHLGYSQIPEQIPSVSTLRTLYYVTRDSLVRRLLYLSARERMKPTLTKIG